MENKLKEALSQTTDTNHYLKKAQTADHPYLTDFEQVYSTYSTCFPEEIKDWLSNKMLLNLNPFQEKQFIQYACEATIVKHFADRFTNTIEIEKKINPNNQKDVDLVFSDKGFTFNIEIKCSDFVQKEQIDNKNTLKVQTIGRLPGLDKTLADLQPILDQVSKKMNLDGTDIAKNMDNNLKDFLVSAHKKFNPNATDKELSILSVSCNDAEDLQLWYYYMFKDQGLFTNESYFDTSKYENVDIVMLNNLYYKHSKYFNKQLLNSWDFDNSFVIVFSNPFAKKTKTDALNHFLSICRNFNQEYNDWFVPGTAEEEVKDSRKLADFIKAELEESQGIYLFEQSQK